MERFPHAADSSLRYDDIVQSTASAAGHAVHAIANFIARMASNWRPKQCRDREQGLPGTALAFLRRERGTLLYA